MTSRWGILAVLFLARLTMAFQFQSVAALSPLLVEAHGLSLADIGLLIGVYLAPGVVVALPGGAMASRFGDRPVALAGMVLMLIGGLLESVGAGWGVMLAGRTLAGAGGVVLNIVLTKMLVDWFTGYEISTAMAIFVNSWPAGIALALFALPRLAQAEGLAAASWAVNLSVFAGLVLLALLYRTPPGATTSAARLRLSRIPVYPLFLAGLVWAFYNAALATVFGFGPALLTERGWGAAGAGSWISAFMAVLALALPLGGYLADRTGRRDAIILTSLLGFTLLAPAATHGTATALVAILMPVAGVFALAAGPIMTLPSLVLPPEARTLGMGVFFTIYYGVMMIAPGIAGAAADRTGDSGTAFVVGALMALVSAAALVLFRRDLFRRSAGP